jgi:hypothetical protein
MTTKAEARKALVTALRDCTPDEISYKTGIPVHRVERILEAIELPHEEPRISTETAPSKTLPDKPTKGAFQ